MIRLDQQKDTIEEKDEFEDVKIDIFDSEETKEIGINREVSDKIMKKYLIFRPYIEPLNFKPYAPSDKGYYYKFYNTKIKIVEYTFEDNGFKEAPEKKKDEWTIMWCVGAVKP